jgi:hypothetical protein
MTEHKAHLKDTILKNKANLERPKMNASLCRKKDYEKELGRELCENKANQSQSFDTSALLSAGLVRLRSPHAAQSTGLLSEDKSKPITPSTGLGAKSGYPFRCQKNLSTNSTCTPQKPVRK